jgi:hypothetical protein
MRTTAISPVEVLMGSLQMGIVAQIRIYVLTCSEQLRHRTLVVKAHLSCKMVLTTQYQDMHTTDCLWSGFLTERLRQLCFILAEIENSSGTQTTDESRIGTGASMYEYGSALGNMPWYFRQVGMYITEYKQGL